MSDEKKTHTRVRCFIIDPLFPDKPMREVAQLAATMKRKKPALNDRVRSAIADDIGELATHAGLGNPDKVEWLSYAGTPRCRATWVRGFGDNIRVTVDRDESDMVSRVTEICTGHWLMCARIDEVRMDVAGNLLRAVLEHEGGHRG